MVVHVVVPGFDPDPIQRSRIVEVLGQVVDYDRAREVPPEVLEILDRIVLMWGRVLPVEPVGYALLSVDVVEDPVGVLYGCKTMSKVGLIEGSELTSGMAAVKITIS